MKKIIGIYKIENLVNHKVYIGQSVDIYKRWEGHKESLRRNTHSAKYLQNSWNKYGEKNFVFEIVEECTKEQLVEKEQRWINHYGGINSKNTYNSREAGSSGTFSEETIEKLKISHLGKNKGQKIPWLKDFDRSNPEYRKKLSKALKGKKKSSIHAEHISKGRTGIQFSEEHRKNIGKSKKGVTTSLKGRKKFEKDGIVKWIKPEDFELYLSQGWKEYHRFECGNYDTSIPWNKGKSCSEELKKHLSEVNKGKRLSEETKKKMSVSRTGTVWIHNDVRSTRIKKSELQEYLDKGWKRGQTRD